GRQFFLSVRMNCRVGAVRGRRAPAPRRPETSLSPPAVCRECCRRFPMTLPAWILLLLAVPVLLVGEWLHRRFAWLPRFNIPVPVVGGLAFALLVLVINASGVAALSFATKVATPAWTWLVTPDSEWLTHPAKALNLPLLVGFFTCVGLGAPVRVLRE